MQLRLRTTLASILGSLALLLAVGHASSDSGTAEVHLQMADLLYGEGRFREALQSYQQAERAEQSDQRLRAAKGVIRASLRVAEFETGMTAAVALNAATPEDPQVAALYGDALWASGRFEEAEGQFEAALRLQPDLAEGHHGMARALAARNQYAAAMERAETALRLSPREGEFHHTRATILERQRRYGDAAAAFGNYLSLLPNREDSDQAALARAKIRFLRSFGDASPIQIEGADPGALYRVKFRLSNDKVLLRGRVNGANVEFVLDTGAEQTVLSQDTARRAGVSPVVQTLSAGVGEAGLRGLLLGRIDTLEIGDLKVRNVPCLIKDPKMDGLPRKERDGFSPLPLGLSMSIDYQAKQLIIGAQLPDEPAETELSLRQHRLALVMGQVKGRAEQDRIVNFIVDTGGEVVSISQATAMALGPSTFRKIPLKVFGTSGWDRDAFLLPGVDLQFREVRLTNFPVVVLNLRAPSALLGFQVGGIVGHQFLSRYRPSIDLQRSVLRLADISS